MRYCAILFWLNQLCVRWVVQRNKRGLSQALLAPNDQAAAFQLPEDPRGALAAAVELCLRLLQGEVQPNRAVRLDVAVLSGNAGSVQQQRIEHLRVVADVPHGFVLEKKPRKRHIANTVPVILTDEKQAKRFAEKVLSASEKVKQWFEKLLKDLRAILDKAYNALKREKSWEQMELIRNNKQTLDMIADYYFEGMEGTKDKAKGDNVNLSLKDIGGRKTVWIENNTLSAKELRNHKAVADYIAEHIGEVYTIIESGQKVYLGKDLPTEYTHSKYTTYLQKYDRSTLKAKNKASGALGEMIEIATNRRWEETQHTHNKDARYGMYRYDSSFAFPVKNSDGSIKRIYSYDAELLIRNPSDGKKYLYDIINIKENTPDTLELPKQEAQMRSQEAPAHGDAFSNIISSDGKDVKLSAKDINADIREVNPMEITPPNRVTSSSKYHYLINEFENNGYNGRRVVLVENGNDGYQALTGSQGVYLRITKAQCQKLSLSRA